MISIPFRFAVNIVTPLVFIDKQRERVRILTVSGFEGLTGLLPA